jgi:predicted acylesterase/phospholipase RssA
VLDRLFEDDRLWVAAISGASAGAMNAVVAAHGFQLDGPEGARAQLRAFWKAVETLLSSSSVRLRSVMSRMKKQRNWPLPRTRRLTAISEGKREPSLRMHSQSKAWAGTPVR